ncbi:MAG: ribosome small subunit-dependent GTPase A [Planctomycetota bacterium]
MADRHADEDFIDQQASERRTQHTGEHLLAKFNRLTRSTAAEAGTDGVVCGFEGTRIQVRNADGAERPCEIRSALTKMLSGVKSPLCIGDRVRFQTLEDGTSVIVALLERQNQLVRTDSHNRALLHVFAANVDHLVIVASAAEPALKPGLIDRYLLIAHLFEVAPLVVLNKSDLAETDSWARLYRRLDYPVFQTVAGGPAGTLDGLQDHLAGHTCVLAGQSGVGKSSLINSLAPDLDIRIGSTSTAVHKGRHTTTAARSYVIGRDITIMDTPGIRECGIPPIEPLDVALLYRDIASHHHDCRFPDCTHTHEPHCAVKAAVEAGKLAASRYDSYRSILDEDLAG